MVVRYLWVLALLLSGVYGLAADFPMLGPGLTYRLERDGTGPWAVCVLSIERARPEYRLVSTLAQGRILGLAPLPVQAKGLSATLGTPIAAINGDFFTLAAGPYQGDLSNLFIHQGELVSVPTWGDAIWFDAQGQPHLDHIAVDLRVTWGDGTRTQLALNGPRPDDGAALYTPIFGASTHTTGGRELVLEAAPDRAWLPLRAGQTLTTRIRDIRQTGDSTLAPNSMILSLGPRLPNLPAIAVGDTLTLSATAPPLLDGVETALGGSPILLRNGEVKVKAGTDDPRHPRTLFGWNATHYFFIVIDGRRPGWSIGMTTAESAALAQRLGCTDAINFDGGGSSTLWLNDQIMNLPSDNAPRPVGNGLVLLKRPDVKK